jgi:ATP-dependent Clp protease ATP-binding subunit ClpA
MFQRFTDRARAVVVLAQEEARMLNHNYIGTEHILVGLIREDGGVAARGLESLGISVDAARQQVEEMVGRGEQAPPGHIPFTPRAKKVLELAMRESLQLGHEHIGTEHILLGLIGEGDGVAVQVLVRLGADLNQVRQQVIQRLHGFQGEDEAGIVRGVQRPGLLGRIDAIERRLSILEQRVGTRTDMDDLDQEIAHVRREKEAAIERQDFDAAAALRTQEKRLLAAGAGRDKEWAEAAAGRMPLAQELGRVKAELEKLRAALREHGIDPPDGAA